MGSTTAGWHVLGWMFFLLITLPMCVDLVLNVVFTCIAGYKAKKFKSKKLVVFSVVSGIALIVFAIARVIAMYVGFSWSGIYFMIGFLIVGATWAINIALLIIFTVILVKENKKHSTVGDIETNK